MRVTALGRLLVLARRIADALDRLAPPPIRATRRVEFSIASDADFERGYDGRNAGTDDLVAATPTPTRSLR